MSIMSLKSFKDSTAKWWSLRNGAIEVIDKKLERYHAAPNDPTRLTELKVAVDGFKQEKDAKFSPKGGDYKSSKREHSGAITLLSQQVDAASAGPQPAMGTHMLTGVANAAQLKAIARQNRVEANSIDIAVPVSQQLDYRDGTGLKNFAWTVKFKMTEAPTELVIKVSLKASTTGAVSADYQKLWPTYIGSAWNGAVIVIPTASGKPRRLRMRFELEWCASGYTGPAYTVDVHQPPPQPAEGDYVKSGGKWTPQAKSAVVGTSVGTPHMGQWGADDRVAVVHEFGHMIGCPDEYYTKTYNGIAMPADTYDQVPFTTDSIMNNTGPEGRIFSRHYHLVKLQYETWQGLPADSTSVVVSG